LKELERIVSALKETATIGIASHINPDGDSVGSLLALAMVLDRAGKRVRPCIPEPWKFPPQYGFLPGREMLIDPGDLEEGLELFVALDCSNPERLGPLQAKAESARTLINIDRAHHHQGGGLVSGA
jgi:phosphoesterase RecJ-like protein